MASILMRSDIERREETNLAPYAALSSCSRGRVYTQEEHPLRTAYQRDRDRIVHCAAFRRLEYKTQVFIPHERDHFRTRLTHTIEVAQISRTLARNLRLNEDLAEAVALVHDLGHTPFGHAGEEVLNDLLADLGGFNHNLQSLRVVDLLEQRYPAHPGLNLTFEVREGIVKHETTTQLHLAEFDPWQQPTLEASLVDIADEIAYNSHDIDDGLSSGLIGLADLKEAAFWRHFHFTGDPAFSLFSESDRRYALVRRLVNEMTTDVINETSARLTRYGITDLSGVRTCANKMCGYSELMQEIVRDTKELLKRKLYRHPRLQAM
ncbi:MAG TPA: deoxyguanosinetriphosphate triphosphohydrolase, partial [Candidatus Deferrimicrobium sp.]|nr:deoxyguanosinetriphosphate triphosphohydrolase [Candidatus Deferrimicrobium sp.]